MNIILFMVSFVLSFHGNYVGWQGDFNVAIRLSTSRLIVHSDDNISTGSSHREHLGNIGQFHVTKDMFPNYAIVVFHQ